MPVAPPDFAICAAVEAATRSPCAKSKRGAAVFDPRGTLLGAGFNGQPEPFTCTGSPACRASCGKLCVHAEQRALREARTVVGAFVDYSDGRLVPWSGLELVHAKVVDGSFVAGGGPSCWQCSREILDVGLAAVWLYRLPTVAEANAAGVFHMDDPMHVMLARWQRYTAEECHRVTLATCDLGGGQ